MFLRALIVLLVVLNLGVAAWWVSRPDPAPAVVPSAASSGVPALELVTGAAPSSPASAVAPAKSAVHSQGLSSSLAASPTAGAKGDAAAATASEPPESRPPEPVRTAPPTASMADVAKPVPAPVCASLGPFTERAQAEAAVARLAGRIARQRLREEGGTPTGFRVYLPVAGDREAALAVAKRIVAAGFADYYLQPAPESAGTRTIALGKFSTEARAQAHRQRLLAAGFQARVEPVANDAGKRWWVDLRLNEGLDRKALASLPARSLACERLR